MFKIDYDAEYWDVIGGDCNNLLRFTCYSEEQARWLLKVLNALIPEGLAIDKTKPSNI